MNNKIYFIQNQKSILQIYRTFSRMQNFIQGFDFIFDLFIT